MEKKGDSSDEIQLRFSSGSVQVPVGWWKLGLVLIKLISGPTSRVSVKRHLGGEHGR